MYRHPIGFAWLALILVSGALSNIAAAGTYRGPDLGDQLVDFALHLERSNTRLRYDGVTYDSTVERLGVTLTQSLGPGLDGLLSAGYEDITQADNPDLAGQAPNGYYGGIALRGHLLSSRRFDAAVSVHYSYHRLDTSPASDQDITLTWHQAWAEVVAGVRPSARLRLFAGARYGVLNGDQRLSGSVNRTTGFHQDTRTGYFGGLDVNVDRTGHVGLRVDGGQFRGAEMFFARRF
ncbi:MAG TPA: hypothetical protein VKA50_08375 [Gammaproteobacteria bacterium]|nr:hypothetical protein [Gammaproteobacteria bacterium]